MVPLATLASCAIRSIEASSKPTSPITRRAARTISAVRKSFTTSSLVFVAVNPDLPLVRRADRSVQRAERPVISVRKRAGRTQLDGGASVAGPRVLGFGARGSRGLGGRLGGR